VLIDPIVQMQGKISSVEMAELIDNNATYTISIPPTETDRWQQLVSSDLMSTYDVMTRRGNLIHLARSQDMPGSALAKALLQERNGEAGLVVAAWFRDNGLLADGEYLALARALAMPRAWNEGKRH
jgi:hypothetical protein